MRPNLSNQPDSDSKDEKISMSRMIEIILGWVLFMPLTILVVMAIVSSQWTLAVGVTCLAAAICPPLRLRERSLLIWLFCLTVGFCLS